MSHHRKDRASSASNEIEDDDTSAVVHSSSKVAAVTPSTRDDSNTATTTPFDSIATTAAIPRQNLFPSSSSSPSAELVVLNVGGHTFTTTRSTLFSVPGSYLEAMFSGRHAHCAHQTVDGAYFIDRDGRFVQAKSVAALFPLLNFVHIESFSSKNNSLDFFYHHLPEVTFDTFSTFCEPGPS
jgi:BTB/POZ domain